MAKKTRKRVASKAARKSKAATKKAKKAAPTKKRRKAAAQKKSKPAVSKKPAAKKVRTPRPESLPERVADVFTAIVDTLTDAERLHHKLDPGVSREPE